MYECLCVVCQPRKPSKNIRTRAPQLCQIEDLLAHTICKSHHHVYCAAVWLLHVSMCVFCISHSTSSCKRARERVAMAYKNQSLAIVVVVVVVFAPSYRMRLLMALMEVGIVVAGAQSVVSCTTWHIHKHRYTCAHVAEGERHREREKQQGPAVNSRSARMHHYYKFHATSLRPAVAAATLTLMAHRRRRRLGSVMAATATRRLPRQPAAVTGAGAGWAVVHAYVNI